MKIYISCDMEGIGGVVHSDQTDPARPEYLESRRLMLGEVNAAIEGARKTGAAEILVNDAHWSMRNLPIQDLDPAAVLLSGEPKPYSMMAGIDKSFDAALFIGYHARAGSVQASIDHTYDGPETVQDIWLNGTLVGEYGLNAALAGYYGVPVALITGDQTVCAQAKELLGDDLEAVVVKEAITRTAAKSLHPTRVHELIRDAAERALKKKREPFVVKAPVTVRLGLARSSQADRCMLMPNVKRAGPRVVEFTHVDFSVLFNAFQALLVLSDVNA